ncbi:MAG: Xaa-Pro peptidase family protein [Candidatus Alcyoniella australis]|nr:Xaa-Pro peptidase family protein [Candidatus Alcyoniella australis]
MPLTQSHKQFLTPKGEIDARLAALRTALERQGIAAAWIEHKSDLLYYCGSLQDGVLLVPASGPTVFYVRASRERAAFEASVEVQPFPGFRALAAELTQLCTQGAAGLTLDVIPASTYLRLAKALDTVEIKDLAPTIRLQRATKSQWEIEQLRGAAQQAMGALRYIPTQLKPGISELELSALIEAQLRRLGHGGVLRLRRMGQELALIMAVSGASASYPTNFDGPVGGEAPYPSVAAGAGRNTIVADSSFMSDMVTMYNGYHSDNARTFFLGADPPPQLRAAHDFCVEALQRLESAARPGRTCADVFCEVDAWAKQVGEPPGFMGFGENRVKFFGHGVGLELDELPVIADRVELELQAGMIIAVEPKAFLPQIGPAGLENTYLVTDQGLVSLCDHPHGLILVTDYL